jgi:hypothetical protein
MLGSSNIYNDPTKLLPRDVARLILWLSPPERDFDFRLSVKYPKPKLFRKTTLVWISLSILFAIDF